MAAITDVAGNQAPAFSNVTVVAPATTGRNRTTLHAG